jgi:phosphohistidine phosphatase
MKAEPGLGRDDYKRKLTDRGRDDARSIAGALAGRNMLPEAMIHSGAARAKETSEILAAAWPREVALEEDVSLYDAPQSRLLARARALPDGCGRVAFVGHNPGIGELAATLTSSGAHPELSRLAAKYPTGAVAILDFSMSRWEDVERNSAMLALYLTPAELGAKAD